MTIAEAAAKYGVTPQTVYRRLTELNTVKQDVNIKYTLKRGKITHLTEEGITALNACLTALKTDTRTYDERLTVLNTVKQEEEAHALREMLRAAQDELAREREHSRQLAERVADLADKLAELTQNQQVLAARKTFRFLPLFKKRRDV